MSSSGVACLERHFINPTVRPADSCHGLPAAWRTGLLEAYGPEVGQDRLKQMIGHMARQVMEAIGYQIEQPRKSIRITRENLFSSGARCLKSFPPSPSAWRGSSRPPPPIASGHPYSSNNPSGRSAEVADQKLLRPGRTVGSSAAGTPSHIARSAKNTSVAMVGM